MTQAKLYEEYNLDFRVTKLVPGREPDDPEEVSVFKCIMVFTKGELPSIMSNLTDRSVEAIDTYEQGQLDLGIDHEA